MGLLPESERRECVVLRASSCRSLQGGSVFISNSEKHVHGVKMYWLKQIRNCELSSQPFQELLSADALNIPSSPVAWDIAATGQ